jgi:hypothetical protein
MSEKENPGNDEAKLENIKSAPYEPVLLKAFDKLTNQILIFLLAYVILLIGIGVFANELSETLKNLLYIIPILGAGVFVFSQDRKISNDAKNKGINVKGGWVSEKGEVTGVRASSELESAPDNVSVFGGVVKGKVIGYEVGNGEDDEKKPFDVGYLTEMFSQLNDTNRRKLINSAQNYLEKQEKLNG